MPFNISPKHKIITGSAAILTVIGFGYFYKPAPPVIKQTHFQTSKNSITANASPPPVETIQTPIKVEKPTVAPPSDEIVVHVAGQVKKPGIVKLPLNSRVDDAIKAAGGAAKNADLDSINLAAKLIDGKQLYVPIKQPASSKAEPAATHTDPAFLPTRLAANKTGSSSLNDAQPAAHGSRKVSETGGIVSLNHATLDSLKTLPGIGDKTAEKILDYRHSHGSFRSIEDLRQVGGIGAKKLEKIRPYIKL